MSRESKACTKCGIEKQLSEFYPRTDRKGMYSSWCKQCKKDVARGSFFAEPLEFEFGEPDYSQDIKAQNLKWLSFYLDQWECTHCRTKTNLRLYSGTTEISEHKLVTNSLDYVRDVIVPACDVRCVSCANKKVSVRVSARRSERVPDAVKNANLGFQVERSKSWRPSEDNPWKFTVQSKVQLLADVRERTSCQICGEWRSPTLEFHHLDVTNKIEAISRMARDSTPLTVFLAELEKCAVVCANCHKLLHTGDVDSSHLYNIRVKKVIKT